MDRRLSPEPAVQVSGLHIKGHGEEEGSVRREHSRVQARWRLGDLILKNDLGFSQSRRFCSLCRSIIMGCLA